MSLFRSAPMKYYELFIPKELAYDTVSNLAKQSFVEFIDAAPNSFHRPYFNSIRRCQQAILKIVNIIKIAKRFQIDISESPNVQQVFKKHQQIIDKKKINSLAYLDIIQEDVQHIYQTIDQSMKTLTISQKQIVDLQDFKYLLFKARQIFGTKKQGEDSLDFSTTTLAQLRLVNISGIIRSCDMLKFYKMIFRATKGNSVIYTFNIPNDSLAQKIQLQNRTAFIIIIQSGTNIINKINRICQSFSSKKYNLPTNKQDIFNKIKSIQNTINDTKQLCIMTQKKLKQQLKSSCSLQQFNYAVKLQFYKMIIQRQIIIFQKMNYLAGDHQINSIKSTLIAKIWVPQQDISLLMSKVMSQVTIRQPFTQQKPPSHFQINQFTAPFQQIVNTYGVPRYGQVNPALFAIPIFPFLFGVMFGDIGHGGVLLALSIWLTVSKDGKKMLPDVFNYRYLLLMMGGFAFYSGWIYNQFFSIPLNLFGSCYGHTQHGQQAQKIQGCVYPIGFDPKWIKSSNQLNYFNSYKMKFAVIVGVLQMTLAIFLKALNTLHFRSYIDFFFEWLPQQIFFACTFGYMCLLIIFKWTINWGVDVETSQAPSIIAQMIALPLQMGSTQGKPLWDLQSQEKLQYNLLMISLICVPWMLIIKPFILWVKSPPKPNIHEKAYDQLSDSLIQDNQQTRPNSVHNSSHEQHDISEIAVHQIIQTIQFVLGTISNTASYLRLWALSLAHGQLSKVFLQKTIGGGIQSSNTLIIAIGMYFFFNITVGVIMSMDTMQCFLHALRLQWVEFNSKFFKADGRKFQPLTIQKPVKVNAAKLRASLTEN